MDRKPYSLSVATAPATEPVSLADAKRQCRIDGTDEDTKVQSLIAAARECVEAETGRTLVTTTYTMKFTKFPGSAGRIVLPRTPLASVSGITYRDTDSATQTFSSSLYKVRLGDVYSPGYVVPKDGEKWPETDDDPDSVTVTFVAGTAEASVPESVRLQVLMLVGYWYERPETMGEPVKGFEQAFGYLRSLNAVPHLA